VRNLKTQTCNALSYCFDLLSFIFQDKDAGNKINSIYLFGSAVRGTLHSKSDIDLFIDCSKEDQTHVQKIVEAGIVKFNASKDYQKWKLFQFTFPFSIQVGILKEWDLQLSIASEGLLLYAKKNIFPTGERKVLFIITLPKKKNQYIKIRRLLFGRNEHFYKGTGLIPHLKGEKISSNTFLVPKEEQTRIIEILAEEKINFTMKEITLL